MKDIRPVSKSIYQYVFTENDSKPDLEVNITALISGKKALLIDTAYSRHAVQVKQHLQSQGIEVEKIVLSHYHPDHAAGATEFPDAELLSSVNYKDNFKQSNEVWDKEHDYRQPEVVLMHEDEITFGDFTLRFVEAPGHSECSLVTIIDNEAAHVGDLIMSDSNGKPIIPYICADGSFTNHIASLQALKELSIERLLLSHGAAIKKSEIDKEVNRRAYYLEKVYESGGTVSLDDALLGGSSKWNFVQWHEYNLKNL